MGLFLYQIKGSTLQLTIIPTVLRPKNSFIICSREATVAFVLILQSAVFIAYAPSWFQRCTEISQPNRHHI